MRKAKEDELARKKSEIIGQNGEISEEKMMRLFLPAVIRYIEQSGLKRKKIFKMLE